MKRRTNRSGYRKLRRSARLRGEEAEVKSIRARVMRRKVINLREEEEGAEAEVTVGSEVEVEAGAEATVELGAEAEVKMEAKAEQPLGRGRLNEDGNRGITH